LAECKW